MGGWKKFVNKKKQNSCKKAVYRIKSSGFVSYFVFYVIMAFSGARVCVGVCLRNNQKQLRQF